VRLEREANQTRGLPALVLELLKREISIMSNKKSAKKSDDSVSDESVDVSTEVGDDDIDIPVQTALVTQPDMTYPRAAATPEQRAHATTAAQDTVMRITEVVINALDKLNDGEKTTLKELQTLVADQTGLKGSNIGPVISMIVRTHGDVSVELGRYGGIYRGKRVKPEKAPDTKTRCNHCHQVIRQKTGKRKKDGNVLAAATTDVADDLELDEDDLDTDDSDDDDDDLDDEVKAADAN